MLGDLAFLKNEEWDTQIKQHVRYGGKVLGICGGMQMLGSAIFDPDGVESSLKEAQGLSLSDFKTTLSTQKVLTKITATMQLNDNKTRCSGYEIHAGISEGVALNKPFLTFNAHPNGFLSDGFISDDNAVAGTYLHGLFDEPAATEQILNWVKPQATIKPISIAKHREQQLERLATVCEAHLNIQHIISIYEGHNNDR